ncbi:MAG: hypothetical protein MZW92_47820 [Comamonadaceae bacterium]|nr:hypothetical protein [Comamonadaceae bacterium]
MTSALPALRALEPMDPKLIYRKTPQGEEALKERTQLKAGRLRAALIMVDGHASAGELPSGWVARIAPTTASPNWNG